jgi:hypothetical protein
MAGEDRNSVVEPKQEAKPEKPPEDWLGKWLRQCNLE